ncbi:MAG: hypothetical protein NTW55_04365 [Planctomycetota bacterium]|nr:hypothetical protein [Planctomycetota bacterium]
MAQLAGFNLQSLIIGCKYTRAFSVDSVSGILADYVLGETGAAGSPVPKKFYERIRFGVGMVELLDKEETHHFTVTRDAMVLIESTKQMAQSLEDTDRCFALAKHLIPGSLALIKKPKAINLGIVWQFTKTSTKERERFAHPAAEALVNKLTKFNLKPIEHPSDMNLRMSFRKQTEEGHVQQDVNDYLNINLHIRDAAINELWPIEPIEKEYDWDQETRIATISVDMQRVFDPRIPLTADLITAHWEYCNRQMEGRISQLLGEVGFGKESDKN